MKKLFTFLIALMMSFTMWAESPVSFAYEAGAEVVSSYIWRGQNNGGLSFQPSATVGFDAVDEHVQFRFNAWGSVGASDWMFRSGLPDDAEGNNPNTYFIPELDLSLSLSAYGATVGVTHFYYFGGTPYFAKLTDDGGSQTEVQIGYNFGELTPANLYINWYTMVAGNDAWYDDNDDAHRAYSTYIELGYDFELPYDMTLGLQVGMTPWKSLYTDYEGGFAVNNVAARLGKTWNIKEVCDIELYALGSINTYNINKTNCYINDAGDYKLYKQKLNGCVGVGFWF